MSLEPRCMVEGCKGHAFFGHSWAGETRHTCRAHRPLGEQWLAQRKGTGTARQGELL